MSPPALDLLTLVPMTNSSSGLPSTREKLFASWQIDKQKQLDSLLRLDEIARKIFEPNSGG